MALILRRPEARLHKLVGQPGGKSIEHALRDADLGLADLRSETLASVQTKLHNLLTAASGHEPNPSQAPQFYQLAVEIADMAGMFGLTTLTKGALGLADLLDFCRAGNQWHWPAIQVHIRGMLVLTDADEPSSGRGEPVLEGLRRVRERVGLTGG